MNTEELVKEIVETLGDGLYSNAEYGVGLRFNAHAKLIKLLNQLVAEIRRPE